ncbi:MAG: hypothetical protein P1V21_01130 [Rhizobiaceae bacterium]|nr:hypothetical protein [Rhizobiaceae bacterium]
MAGNLSELRYAATFRSVNWVAIKSMPFEKFGRQVVFIKDHQQYDYMEILLPSAKRDFLEEFSAWFDGLKLSDDGPSEENFLSTEALHFANMIADKIDSGMLDDRLKIDCGADWYKAHDKDKALSNLRLAYKTTTQATVASFLGVIHRYTIEQPDSLKALIEFSCNEVGETLSSKQGQVLNESPSFLTNDLIFNLNYLRQYLGQFHGSDVGASENRNTQEIGIPQSELDNINSMIEISFFLANNTESGAKEQRNALEQMRGVLSNYYLKITAILAAGAVGSTALAKIAENIRKIIVEIDRLLNIL